MGCDIPPYMHICRIKCNSAQGMPQAMCATETATIINLETKLRLKIYISVTLVLQALFSGNRSLVLSNHNGQDAPRSTHNSGDTFWL